MNEQMVACEIVIQFRVPKTVIEPEKKDQAKQETKALLPLDEDAIDPKPRELFQIWNTHCGSLAKAQKLTPQRRAKIKTRLTEEPDLNYWTNVVQKMAASDFCRQNKFATLDWIIENSDNHVKAAEGKYDNKPSSKSDATPTVNADALIKDLNFG